MTRFFYYDGNGKKLGPYNATELIALAANRCIFPNTTIETESGVRRKAEEVEGLLPPPFSGETKMTLSAQFSRAVFIFLAVFVGIFGIHDFYVKRARYGWIHLALMSPWILTFLVTVLFVFGYSLFILCSTSFNREVRATKNAIKECEKEITENEKEILKLQETLKKVMTGEEWKPETVGGNTKKTVTPETVGGDTKKTEKTETVSGDTKETEEPEGVGPGKMNAPEKTKKIDVNYAKELEQKLSEAENLLRHLQRQRELLQSQLMSIKVQQTGKNLSAWVSTGPLWLYFFFFALPVVSWIIAMFEIVRVTRDGTGKELGF
ncbi:MAG: TM2 domain-containing protein [Planctomycetaceae bacterium]|jgi:TM2 domain-containing membrane protein YozV|nr:TM2 domain-containing protein [Planctomycetaceae bacterium]